MVKSIKKNERRRLITAVILIMFFLAFVLFNIEYKTGALYMVLLGISFLTLIFWDKIPKKRPDRKMFSFQKDWKKDGLIGIGIGLGVLFLFSAIPGLSLAVPSAPQSIAFPEPLATAGQWTTVVGVASLTEEVAFRTTLFAILFIVMGLSFFYSAVLSSAFFSIFHTKAYAGVLALDPILAVSGAFVSAFLVAMLFCYVNKFRGSVSTSIGAHGSINAGLLATKFIVI